MRAINSLLAALALAAALAGPAKTTAAADAATRLTWTGYGHAGPHCFKYKMHVVVRLLPGKVSGTFQQQGRPLYHFSFPADAGGAFAGTVQIHGGKLDLKGTATPAGGTVSLIGYCTFAGALKPAK